MFSHLHIYKEFVNTAFVYALLYYIAWKVLLYHDELIMNIHFIYQYSDRGLNF